MANIDVQRKKSSPLPWIILVVLILAILAFFLWNRSRNAATTSTVTDSTSTVTDSTRVHDTTKTYPLDTSRH
jgi:multidrug resistance efflux pump